MAAIQQTTTTAFDPLLQQAGDNKVNESPPTSSGSHPPVEQEAGKQTHEESVVEEKLARAFGKSEHDKELSGAGVGNHPVH